MPVQRRLAAILAADVAGYSRLMGEDGRGTIVNTGASFVHAGTANSSAVTTAKMGLAGLTGSLAVELAPQEVTVNCVAPGRIERPGSLPTPTPGSPGHA